MVAPPLDPVGPWAASVWRSKGPVIARRRPLQESRVGVVVHVDVALLAVVAGEEAAEVERKTT